MIIARYVLGILLATIITMVCLWVSLKIVGGYASFPILLLFAFVTFLLGIIPYVGLPISIVVLAYLLYKKANVPTPVSAVLAAGITRLITAFMILGLKLWLIARTR